MKKKFRGKVSLQGKVIRKEYRAGDVRCLFRYSLVYYIRKLLHWNLEKWMLHKIREAEIKGKIKPLAQRVSENLIVTVGKQHVAELLAGITSTSFNYIRVGDSSQTPALTDTDIIGALTLGKQVTDRFRTTNKACFSTFAGSAEGNGTWAECVLATALSGGTILCRALFTTFVKDSSKTETVDWEITCG